MTRFFVPLAALLLATVALSAQHTSASPSPAIVDTVADAAGTDTIFLRAQRMAAEGQGDAARAVVQHELDIAAAGSPRYVDALYWRAVVAATAADAERDLRRIIIEFPLSPRNEDALLRLAQLEMTRGDNDQALTHLQRLVIDHPASPSRARASFWMARVYFDKNQAPAACRSLADAAQNTAAAQVEQHNQIDFWQQRCRGVDTSSAAKTVVATHVDSAPPRETEPVPTTVAPPIAPPPAPVPAPRTTSTTTSASRTTATVTAPRSAGATQYTVQVAAYPTIAEAERFRKGLAARGVTARIAGASKPYRVRVGRYDTRAQAEASAASLKAKKIAVYVTEAEPR